MGCFDYECECGGSTCPYVGAQNGGDSTVVIEVPLNDGTTVFIKGDYDMYGAVEAVGCKFYAEQFHEYMKGWLSDENDSDRNKIFLAKRIWTHSHYDQDDDGEMTHHVTECVPPNLKIKVKVGPTTSSMFIRADKDLNIPSDDEKQKKRIEKLKTQCDILRKELGRTGKP